MMKLVSLIIVGTGAAAGFVGSKLLLGREQAPQGLPSKVQGKVDAAHGRLQRVRDRAAEGFAAAREERDMAERQLRADYLARTGRTSSSIPSGTPRID
jgi:hypothetical protein